MRTLRPCLVLIVALSALSCAKSDAEKFADAFCSEVATCCKQAGLPSDGKTCHEWMAFASMGGSFNSSAADACLAEVQAQRSAGKFCESGATTPSCDSVYGNSATGTKKAGDRCDLDSDCAPSSDGEVACAGLVDSSGSWIHQCQIRMPGKAGDSPCVGTKDGDIFESYEAQSATTIAPRGYSCDLANNVRCENGTCVALVALGGTCMISTACVNGAYCSYPGNTCTAKNAVGGACSGIAGSECVDSAYCDSNTKKCAAKVASGGACTSSTMCQSFYCSNEICKGSTNIGATLMCGS